ncbi:hypothetical protein HUU05_01005 [candidate division KSB1 bacterium]|nr:hypothetical protein [candidate division KSB1 bacterium]
MKSFVALLGIVFLLLALGCSKNPSESVVEKSRQLDVLSRMQKSEDNKLPTSIKLKGKIKFSDGTAYESDTEKSIDLPQHLWASFEESATEGLGTDYYVMYQEYFIINGYVTFRVRNYPVNSCYETWKHRITINFTNEYPPAPPFSIRQILADFKGAGVYSESYRDFPPSTPSGTYSSPFANFSSYRFDDDGDIDALDGIISSSGGFLWIGYLRGHLNGSNASCQ